MSKGRAKLIRQRNCHFREHLGKVSHCPMSLLFLLWFATTLLVRVRQLAWKWWPALSGQRLKGCDFGGSRWAEITSFSGGGINCPQVALVFPNGPALLSDAETQDVSLSLISFLIFSLDLFLWCPFHSDFLCYSSPEHSRALISNQPCWDSSGFSYVCLHDEYQKCLVTWHWQN